MNKKEKWLYENEEAFASVKRGLEDSAFGDIKDLGSFSEFLDYDCDLVPEGYWERLDEYLKSAPKLPEENPNRIDPYMFDDSSNQSGGTSSG